VPLALTHGRTEATHTFVLRDHTSVLVDARVAPAADADRRAAGPLRDPLLLGVAGRDACEPFAAGSVGSVVEKGARSAAAAHPLPISRTCFACGVDNTLGLRARLTFDARAVGGAWAPRPSFRAADGRLSSAALTTLLDETAFWLGALATGEAGMTTELAVTLHGDAPAGGAVLVGGARAATRPRAGDARYWRRA